MKKTVLNQDRVGAFAIAPGNEHMAPQAVFVDSINGMGVLRLRVLNGSTMRFADPGESNLLDLDYQHLERLRAEWDIASAERQLQRARESYRELLVKPDSATPFDQ